MQQPFYLVGLLDKIGEARFYLAKLESEPRWPEVIYYTSAFGSACYSLLQCLEKQCKPSSEGKAWWDRVFAVLTQSPVHVYFHSRRNMDTHEGFPMVSGIEFSLTFAADGDLVSSERAVMAATKAYAPRTPAEACRDYFNGLASLAGDAYDTFSSRWDPEGQLQAEFQRLRESTHSTAH